LSSRLAKVLCLFFLIIDLLYFFALISRTGFQILKRGTTEPNIKKSNVLLLCLDTSDSVARELVEAGLVDGRDMIVGTFPVMTYST